LGAYPVDDRVDQCREKTGIGLWWWWRRRRGAGVGDAGEQLGGRLGAGYRRHVEVGVFGFAAQVVGDFGDGVGEESVVGDSVEPEVAGVGGAVGGGDGPVHWAVGGHVVQVLGERGRGYTGTG
jgi:hypothetical protein